jgi:hypothetical protein
VHKKINKWLAGLVGTLVVQQFRSPSMDATRQAVRQKLNKVHIDLLLAVQETLQIYEGDKFDHFCLIMST